MKIIKDGREVEMEMVIRFGTDENNKKFVVYTDRSKDEKGGLNLYAYYYIDNENDIKPVLSEDFKLVEEVLKQVKESYSQTE